MFAFGCLLFWLVATLGWWGLAFYPLPEASPEWLLRARSVCFGSVESGLPDAYGWLGLFLGPGSLLGVLVTVWGRELRTDLKRVGSTVAGKVLLLTVLAAPVAGASWVVHRVAEGMGLSADLEALLSESEEVGPLPLGYTPWNASLPEFELVDQEGRVVRREHLDGRVSILTFAYGRCATVCPVLVTRAREAAREASEISPPLVVVSVDPWRDKPSRLEHLAHMWALPAGGRVLSGEVESVLDVLEAFEVPIERNPRDGEIRHPALVYVVDGQGRIAYRFNNPPTGWIAEAVRRAAADGPR